MESEVIRMADVTQIKKDCYTSSRKCYSCNEPIKFCAIAIGNHDITDVEFVFKEHIVTKDVVLINREIKNNGRTVIANLESNVECPRCLAKNRFDKGYVTLIEHE
jgi:hypothetical protein